MNYAYILWIILEWNEVRSNCYDVMIEFIFNEKKVYIFKALLKTHHTPLFLDILYIIIVTQELLIHIRTTAAWKATHVMNGLFLKIWKCYDIFNMTMMLIIFTPFSSPHARSLSLSLSVSLKALHMCHIFFFCIYIHKFIFISFATF